MTQHRILMIATTVALAICLAAPASAARIDDLQLVYQATFANGSLESGIDPLKIGALKFGDTGQADINPTWTAVQGDYLVSVSRPTNSTAPAFPTYIAGIYATPVNFDVGSIVRLRGTFVAPVGPHNSTDVWAVSVGVRTGGVGPLTDSPGAFVTFQVRGDGARLNTPGSSVSANLPNVPQEVYDAIFNPTDPQPFTIEMSVDRVNGRGEATLKVGDVVVSRPYEFAIFTADSGPAITNVGLNIAAGNTLGQLVSVRMRDFQIFTSKRHSDSTSSDPLCPPEFGCRRAPSSQPN